MLPSWHILKAAARVLSSLQSHHGELQIVAFHSMVRDDGDLVERQHASSAVQRMQSKLKETSSEAQVCWVVEWMPWAGAALFWHAP